MPSPGGNYPGERSYRIKFRKHNGSGPWPCHDCGELVQPVELEVHHVDGNHSNHVISNLAAIHPGCHVQCHKLGIAQDPDVVLARADANRGQKRTAEQRAKISEAKKAAWAAGIYENRRKRA